VSSTGSGEGKRVSRQGGARGVGGSSERRSRGRVYEDPRQKLMKRLVPLLFVGLAGAIFWSVRSTLPSCKGADKQAVETEVELASVEAEDIVIAWERPAAVTGPVRNPMLRCEVAATEDEAEPEVSEASPGEAEGSEGAFSLSLTGIVYSADEPMAIVEKQIVHVGDTIGDVRVVEITKTSVEFEKEGQKWRQELKRASDLE